MAGLAAMEGWSCDCMVEGETSLDNGDNSKFVQLVGGKMLDSEEKSFLQNGFATLSQSSYKHTT